MKLISALVQESVETGLRKCSTLNVHESVHYCIKVVDCLQQYLSDCFTVMRLSASYFRTASALLTSLKVEVTWLFIKEPTDEFNNFPQDGKGLI